MNYVEIDIHNLTFRFELYDGNPRKDDGIGGYIEEDICGATFRSKLVVLLNKNLPEQLFRRTIIHEMTHCYIWAFGLMQFDSYKEENICDFMETWGTSIITDSLRVISKFDEFKEKEKKKSDRRKSKLLAN